MDEPDPPQEPQTRAEVIEAARNIRVSHFHPHHLNPVVNAAEQFVSHGLAAWNASQNGVHGLSLNVGGLSIGSQIALGPEYVLKAGDYYQPQLIWDTYAVAATDKSYRIQSGVLLPRLAKGRAFFGLNAYRYEYTRLNYFGPGPDSVQSGVSNYSQRESGVEVRGGIIAHRHLRTGFTGSYRAIAIGPGTSANLPPTDAIYTVATARGIDRQTSFLTGGFFFEYEGRDQPTDPHHGAYFQAAFQNVNGRRRALGGFNQYDFDAQLYIPFWNHRRIIAFRGRASLTDPHQNTFVPFYLGPHLGGSDDLRGFSSFRFHDQNSVIATAEYRWTVMPLLDMTLFADAGKVFHDVDNMSSAHFMSDIGFGFRARSGNSAPIKLDVGISREGVQVWLIFSNPF